MFILKVKAQAVVRFRSLVECEFHTGRTDSFGGCLLSMLIYTAFKQIVSKIQCSEYKNKNKR